MEQFNPLRALDWRWQLACRLVEQQALDPPRNEDEFLLDAVLFRRRLDELQGSAALQPPVEWSPTSEAYSIYFGPDDQRLSLESNLLTGEPLEATATEMDLPLVVIEAYEALFFNVSDRLQAKDYIVKRAIGFAGNDEVDHEAMVRAFAYFGGRLVLDAVREAGVGSRADYIQSLATEAGRNVTRARLAFLVSMSPYSGRIATEIGRVMALLGRFDDNSHRSAAANGPYGALVESLTAASQVSLRRLTPSDTPTTTETMTTVPKAGDSGVEFGREEAA